MLVRDSASDHAHLFDGAQVPQIVFDSELHLVAVEGLRAYVVVDAVAGPLQDGPETLQTIGVGLIPDILADTVSEYR